MGIPDSWSAFFPDRDPAWGLDLVSRLVPCGKKHPAWGIEGDDFALVSGGFNYFPYLRRTVGVSIL